MIFKFRMISDEVENFYRDFELREDQTFYDFHLAIQQNLGYNENEPASFFLANNAWEKELEITLYDMGDEEEASSTIVVMDMSKLSEFINRDKQHIVYLFDYFSNRVFYIEMVGVREDNTDKTVYPVCVEGRGDAPIQIKEDFDMLNLDFDFPEDE